MVTEGSHVKEGARRVRPLLASPPSEEKGGAGRAGAPVWGRGCDGARGARGVGVGREVPGAAGAGPVVRQRSRELPGGRRLACRCWGCNRACMSRGEFCQPLLWLQPGSGGRWPCVASLLTWVLVLAAQDFTVPCSSGVYGAGLAEL